MSPRAKPSPPGTELAVRPARRRSAGRARLGLFERGRLRRRVRFLRKQRELGLRDLGGLIFDMYRFGSKRQDLVREKLRSMFEADRELREFETLLGRRERLVDVREAGVGGSCPRCLTLYSTDSRFCSRCGLDLSAPAEEETGVVDAVQTPGAEAEAPEPPAEAEPPAEDEPPEPRAEAEASGRPPDFDGNGQAPHPEGNGAAEEQLTTEIEASRLASRSGETSRS